VRIGRAVFEPTTGEVRQPGGDVTRLEPQPAAVLALLAATPGELVSHYAMRRALWGDSVHVNFQQNLHYAVRQIRRALGDDDRAAPLIETVPRRGYRLLAPVESGTYPASTQAGDEPRRQRWPIWAAVGAAALLTIAIVERRPNDHHRIAVAALQAVHDLVY
jgi:DNA-binding winged helix-turn-helix (wHTH) protein